MPAAASAASTAARSPWPYSRSSHRLYVVVDAGRGQPPDVLGVDGIGADEQVREHLGEPKAVEPGGHRLTGSQSSRPGV